MSVSKYVSNKSIFQKSIFDNSKANPKYINQNPSFQYLSCFGTQAASLFQELRSLKTCLKDVLKTCLEDLLRTLWRQTKSLLGISVSKYVSNKSIFHKSISDNSKANPKCINQNPSFQSLSSFGTQAASLFQELKSLMTGVVKSAEFILDIAEKVRQ